MQSRGKQQPIQPLLTEVSSEVLQQALRCLGVAFGKFFRGQANFLIFKVEREGFKYRFSANSNHPGHVFMAGAAEYIAMEWKCANLIRSEMDS